jgi:hypothetical protein
LEERNGKLNVIVSKHEQTMDIFRHEALTTKSQLSQVEVQLNFCKQENETLKNAELRLQKENEVIVLILTENS